MLNYHRSVLLSDGCSTWGYQHQRAAGRGILFGVRHQTQTTGYNAERKGYRVAGGGIFVKGSRLNVDVDYNFEGPSRTRCHIAV